MIDKIMNELGFPFLIQHMNDSDEEKLEHIYNEIKRIRKHLLDKRRENNE